MDIEVVIEEESEEKLIFFESLLHVDIDYVIGQSIPLEWAGMYVTVIFPSSSALMLALTVLWCDTV